MIAVCGPVDLFHDVFLVGHIRKVSVSYRGKSFVPKMPRSARERKGNSASQLNTISYPWYVICLIHPVSWGSFKAIAQVPLLVLLYIFLQYMPVSLESLFGPSCYIISRFWILKASSAKHSGTCFKTAPKTNRARIWLVVSNMLWFHAAIPEMMLVFSMVWGVNNHQPGIVILLYFLLFVECFYPSQTQLAETLKDPRSQRICAFGFARGDPPTAWCLLEEPQFWRQSGYLKARTSAHCCGTSSFFNQTLRSR